MRCRNYPYSRISPRAKIIVAYSRSQCEIFIHKIFLRLYNRPASGKHSEFQEFNHQAPLHTRELWFHSWIHTATIHPLKVSSSIIFHCPPFNSNHSIYFIAFNVWRLPLWKSRFLSYETFSFFFFVIFYSAFLAFIILRNFQLLFKSCVVLSEEAISRFHKLSSMHMPYCRICRNTMWMYHCMNPTHFMHQVKRF